MVSQQGPGKKQNKKENEMKNRTVPDTGNSLTFMPGRNLTPIMCFSSDYLPIFLEPLVLTSCEGNAVAVILAAASNLHDP